MKHIIELESGERDVSLYPLSSDYILSLDRTIYNVEKINVVSAVIPRSQTLINSVNKVFYVNSTMVTLDEKNYTSGQDLATDLTTKIPSISVTFNSTTDSLTFTGSTSFTLSFASESTARILGLLKGDTASTGTTLVSGAIDLLGTQSIIMKLSSGDDNLERGLYTSNSGVYFGSFLISGIGSNVIYHYGHLDTIESMYTSSNKKDITSLRVSFHWKDGTELVPYDFRNKNHTVKLELHGNTDKLNSNTIDEDVHAKKELPPVVELPPFKNKIRDISPDKIIPIALAVVLLLGLVSLANRTVKENSTG